MPTLMLLGNCVAQRLEGLLMASAGPQASGAAARGEGHGWRVLRATPVHQAATGPDPGGALAALAAQAEACDLVFSQPLFNYGPCNTEALAPRLGDRLRLVAAPNFEAYFPDVLAIGPPREPERVARPFDWHSRILVLCKAAGTPPEEAAALYPAHPLFRERAVAHALTRTWETYARREQGLHVGTLDVARQWYAREPLFYTWNHPAERLMAVMLDGILRELGTAEARRAALLSRVGWTGGPPGAAPPDGPQPPLDAGAGKGEGSTGAGAPEAGAPAWSFGFNRWPIITRHHRLFAFPGRENFRVAGVEVDLASMALAWYNWYDLHPQTFRAALAAATRRAEGR
ncbi:WcbI family polysaccharide biosynthesis putative acetyltransferase [Desulfovibrio sp.]|uniref:WcbI family polysaccharide biosynthesis putative acetyltransferase n=1 Tax=Desulfovibrio sp. TaxID=885 RepID=UPI0023D2B14E|nr:WcbI family polysaccharide biosynthesis putative acetyltransferase [Desulfovibrio sp.]MDE7240514.1 hypothetical protein [Desulfovibrio sp.]